MNKVVVITCMVLLCLVSKSWASKYELKTFSQDTVVIEVGDSRIVIVVNSPEDLKKLEKFDVNQMIADLNVNLSEDSLQSEEIVLADSIGKTYEKEEEDLAYYDEEPDDTDFNDFLDSWGSDRFNDNEQDEVQEPKRTTGSFNLDLGLNNWLQNGEFPDGDGELYAIKPWGSWYVALGHTNHTNIKGPLYLDWGANVSWYNWKLENRDVRIIKGDEETVFVQDTEVDGQKSKLVGTYLNASIVPVIELGKKRESSSGKNYFGNKYNRRGVRLGLGGYAGYRIDSWTKFVYEEGGDKKKDKQKGNYFLSNFRYGVRGVLGYKATDLFINYDLNSVFADGRGPNLNAISFGIIF